jgi:hypothetical protein
LLHIRVMNPGDDPAIVPGTLEFTTSTGVRYRRSPTRATPPVADLNDVLVATAVAHAHVRAAQRAADEARMDLQHAADRARMSERDRAAGRDEDDGPEYDGQDLAWRRSQAGYIRHRVKERARHAFHAGRLDDPPF